MSLARWQSTIVDELGNVQASAFVEVRSETTGAPLAALYSDRSGVTPLANPFQADSEAYAGFHVAGGAYKITATKGAFSRVWNYVPIGTAQELDAETVVIARGATILASGSLSSTAVNLTGIPDDYAYLFLRIASASTGSTEEIQVMASANNGSSYNSTAGNYVNKNVTGTTWASGSVASLSPATTITAAQLAYLNIYIFGYTRTVPLIFYSHFPNAVPYFGTTYYAGTTPINALSILGSAGGTFDSGSYILSGVR